MRWYPGRWPGLRFGVLLAVATFLPVPLAAGAPGQDREWLECTGEARPPEPHRPPAHRPLPVASDFFDLAAVEAAVRSEGAGTAGEGCALFLMRWNSGRMTESFGVLEATASEATVARIEEALLASRPVRANRTQFMRVRVLVGLTGEVTLETGIAWEVPASLTDPDAVADVLGGVFLEGASWRMALFEVLVTVDGPPATFNLTRSTGNGRVDQHLEWLIPSFTFTAMRVEGVPFGSWLRLPLRLESPQE